MGDSLRLAGWPRKVGFDGSAECDALRAIAGAHLINDVAVILAEKTVLAPLELDWLSAELVLLQIDLNVWTLMGHLGRHEDIEEHHLGCTPKAVACPFGGRGQTVR